jgi:hypothetical protein
MQQERKRSIQFVDVPSEDSSGRPPLHRPAPPAAAAAPSLGASSTRLPPLTLQHFSQTCPGFCGPTARTDIRPRRFGWLLRLEKPIVIPLFQRKFCWGPEQATGWFRDCMKAAPTGDFTGEHGVGKVVFKGRDEAVWCIDGQQRLTTASLLIASARDAALSLLGTFEDADSASTQAQRARAASVVSQAHALLFRDVDAAQNWIDGRAALLRSSPSGITGGAPGTMPGRRTSTSALQTTSTFRSYDWCLPSTTGGLSANCSWPAG